MTDDTDGTGGARPRRSGDRTWASLDERPEQNRRMARERPGVRAASAAAFARTDAPWIGDSSGPVGRAARVGTPMAQLNADTKAARVRSGCGCSHPRSSLTPAVAARDPCVRIRRFSRPEDSPAETQRRREGSEHRRPDARSRTPEASRNGDGGRPTAGSGIPRPSRPRQGSRRQV